MKKLSLCFMLVVSSLFVSCGALMPTATTTTSTETQSAKLVNSATYTGASVVQPVAAVLADLEVSPEKILFLYIPSNTVLQGGEANVINSAVREALLSNGNADVLVALEKQVKYGPNGKIESITVTGYPAKYVNFRSPGDDYLRSMQPQTDGGKKQDAKAQSQPSATSGVGSLLGLGKK